jgi:benzylsuccinate CoA-transferase BbsF subunit
MSQALAGIRICDFTGQLAGAGATKWLAAFGADVIRIEDPVNHGAWDILRAMGPYVDQRRGADFAGGFNNHNVGKRGITLNLRMQRGKELLAAIVEKSDVVTENFAAGVLDKWGFGYERLKEIRSDIIYVSNCGFGHVGPYTKFKTWGPIVQALSGLTFTSGLPDMEPAGWGYSYMDHNGGTYMATAVLLALLHRQRTGEGQWVDMACCDSGLTLNGPAILDYTVNGRPTRRTGQPNSNRGEWPRMAPHGIYTAAGEDEWLALACRDDADWEACIAVIGEQWMRDPRWSRLADRVADQDSLDKMLNEWCSSRDKFEMQRSFQAAGVPAAAVQKPQERIDQDPGTAAFELWPTVRHSKMGEVRVDGLPVRFSRTPWTIERGAPCVGEHTDEVLTELLGLGLDELVTLHEQGVI